jgi:hypothetical protein
MQRSELLGKFTKEKSYYGGGFSRKDHREISVYTTEKSLSALISAA